MDFRKIYGIDIGTSAVKIYSHSKNKIYAEKNMIAVKDGRRVLAVGDEAYEMFEKAPSNIEVSSPMAFGMIADIPRMEYVLSSLMKRVDSMLAFGTVIYFAIPMDLSKVEKRAYHIIANGGRMHNNKVYIVEKPVADAVALGISPEKTKGSMIVNIGSQSTEMSILADGKVIISKMLPIGGRQMNLAICDEVRKRQKLQIGTRTARRLKLVLGDLGYRKDEARKVFGIDSLSGFPREEIVASDLINDALQKPAAQIGMEIRTFLERTPPQIRYHILQEGIYLTGGSTRLPDLGRYLAESVGYGFGLSGLYENCTVTGLKKIIEDKNLHGYIAPLKQQKR